MRNLIVGSLVGFTFMTQAYAANAVIGETKDCSIQTKVIQHKTSKEDYLLVIHENDIFELRLKSLEGSTKYYASSLDGHQGLPPMTFEATIMGEEMSVLSRLKIYLSGVVMECEIEK
jgi:hypothetical protein